MAVKKTVLEIVQDILNDIDGDEVNSINDTVESMQAAQIVKSTYESIINNRDWPHLRELSQLSGSGDVNKPTHMTPPTNTKKIESIFYNKKKPTDTKNKFNEIKYKAPDDFLRFVNKRNSDDSDVDTVTDDSGVVLNIINDQHPTYYTSFDDETLILDSYLNTVDSSLQGSKTQVILYKIPTFTVSDSHVPDLTEEAFPYLIEECKSRAAVKLRQIADAKSESESQKQNRWLSVNSFKVQGGIKYPNYGRKK